MSVLRAMCSRWLLLFLLLLLLLPLSPLRSCVSVAAPYSSLPSCVWLKSCINHHTLIYLNVDFSTHFTHFPLLFLFSFSLFVFLFFLRGLQIISHCLKAGYTFFPCALLLLFFAYFFIYFMRLCMFVWACVSVFVYVCMYWCWCFFEVLKAFCQLFLEAAPEQAARATQPSTSKIALTLRTSHGATTQQSQQQRQQHQLAETSLRCLASQSPSPSQSQLTSASLQLLECVPYFLGWLLLRRCFWRPFVVFVCGCWCCQCCQRCYSCCFFFCCCCYCCCFCFCFVFVRILLHLFYMSRAVVVFAVAVAVAVRTSNESFRHSVSL